MVPRIVMFGLLVLAAGCAPYRGYYREGVTTARLQNDLTACAVEAVQQVPPNTQLRRGLPEFLPGQRVCNRKGRCLTRPGRYVRGPLTSVDVNAPLRAQVQAQCMAARGYGRAEVPLCPSDAPVRSSGTLPPLSPATCVLQSGGRTVFAETAR